MMNEHIVKFAIVGFGHIGQKYASLLLKQNSAKLVAIADVQIASTPIDVPFFSSIENLLQSDIKFDVAIIATPNGLHTQHAITCLKADKHVVIEKPIALNSEDVNAIYEVAKQYNKQVFPVFQNRYAKTSLWLKKLLAQNKLGDIFMIQVNCFWNRGDNYYKNDHWHGTKALDGGTLFTQFSHFIDMLLWLFGPMSDIKATVYNFKHQENTEFEDSGVVTFSLNKGAKGTFNFSTAVFDQNLESSILIIAEKGTVKIGGQYMEKVIYQHAIEDFPESALEQTKSNHQLYLEDLVKVIENDLHPSITENEAIATVATIESIYAATLNN